MTTSLQPTTTVPPHATGGVVATSTTPTATSLGMAPVAAPGMVAPGMVAPGIAGRPVIINSTSQLPMGAIPVPPGMINPAMLQGYYGASAVQDPAHDMGTIAGSVIKYGALGALVGAGVGLIPILPPGVFGGAIIGAVIGGGVGLVKGLQRVRDERILRGEWSGMPGAGLPGAPPVGVPPVPPTTPPIGQTLPATSTAQTPARADGAKTEPAPSGSATPSSTPAVLPAKPPVTTTSKPAAVSTPSTMPSVPKLTAAP